MKDYSDSLARALGSNPAYDAWKRINDVHSERFNSMFRSLDVLNTNIQRAGLPNSAIMNNLYPTSAIEDAVRNLSGVSHLGEAIRNQTSEIQRMVERLHSSGALRQIAEASSVAKQIADYQSQAARQIVDSIRQIVEPTRIAFEQLRPQISLIQDWVLQNQSAFDAFGSFWREFENNYHINEYRAVRVLKKYNWFVSPSLPADFVYEAVRLGRKNGNKQREMNNLFWEYFSASNFKNLSAMVRSWSGNTLFKGKIKILRDCVATLRQLKGRNNPANVVLPTLIPVIDYVLTRFRQRNGLAYTTHGSPNQREELRVWVETEATSQDVLSEPMLELANYVLFSVFLQTAYPGKPLATPFTMSRHKIVHGEFSTYGRKSNVIRAFLILDFLAALE